MNNQLTARIQTKMPQFSKGQKLIAKYIEEHYDKVAFMTASKLGATVGVSESTVVRFATEIGYAGYPQLQRAMQEMIRSKLTSVQRLEITAENVELPNMLDAVFNQDIDIIRRTMEETSHESFYNAVDAIVSSRKVYILGARSSLALATFLSYYFNLIFENVKLVNLTSEAEIFEQMIHVGENDAVIGISFPRYSRKAVKAMHFASDRGANVIAITDSMLSPLAEPAEFVLMARSDMASFVDSLAAPLSLINALIVTTAIKKKDEVVDSFNKLENIWDEYGVYEKVDDKQSEPSI
ncbi:MAG TPA: MurR/RpiR family transcriptional regulator [Oscillospiraceae bacterium]|nr:MurR/RpiR family transcriptional regulator [Oscillospiraceae bacterium]